MEVDPDYLEVDPDYRAKVYAEVCKELGPAEFSAFRALLDLPDYESRLNVMLNFCRGCGRETVFELCYCNWDD